MARYSGSDDFRAAEFVEVDMSDTRFREVDLTNARMRGVMLGDADVDGYIAGLRLNGVEVAPLVEAELNRLHPERAKLRPTTPAGMQEAWAEIESFWATTMRRAGRHLENELHRSVDGEWSFAQTVRHLVFVTDAWLGHAVLGKERPFHRLGLPASFITGAENFGVDDHAEPTYDEVVEVRDQRMAQVADFVTSAAQPDLERVRQADNAPGFPPPEQRTATSCLHVIFNEEWTHHQFAVRDLAIIERAAGE